MMKRRIIFMCCALMAAITICTAQNNTTDRKAALEAKRAEMVKKATERMKNELSLSDEQATKLEELNKEYLPKMRMGAPAMRRHKPMGPGANRPKENFKRMNESKCCNNCCNCCKEGPKFKKGEKPKKFDKADLIRPYNQLYIDVGARDKADAEAMGIEIGDAIVWGTQYEEFGNGRAMGHAFDDKVGCAIQAKIIEEAAKDDE